MGTMVGAEGLRGPCPGWARSLLRSHAVRGVLDSVDSTVHSRPAVHLVVLREPHYSRILSGEKRVEARFCRVKRPPLGVVSPGDVLLLKRAAGPVSAWCHATGVLPLRLAGEWADDVREAFDQALGFPGDEFWNSVAAARFGTLIEVGTVTELPRPVRCMKRDQRGWVVLRRGVPR